MARLHFFLKNMPLRSFSDRAVQVITKIALFVHLGDLHVGVRFGVVNSLAVLLLVRTLVIERYVKEIFTRECCIIPVLSHTVGIIPKYTSPLHPLATLETSLDAEINWNTKRLTTVEQRCSAWWSSSRFRKIQRRPFHSRQAAPYLFTWPCIWVWLETYFVCQSQRF